ncbi:MAG: hypothetical protein U0R17_06665 [Acidimicrobiia bacterium]
MRFPDHDVDLVLLMSHVQELQNYRKQFATPKSDLGNCTTFSVSLATRLARNCFPNGSRFALQNPTLLSYSASPHQNIFSPPDYIQMSVGAPRKSFSTLQELVEYVSDPNNGVHVGLVDGAGHAFNIIRTTEGIKIADGQYGIVCDVQDYKNCLALASGIPDRSLDGYFGLINIADHNPAVAMTLDRFVRDMSGLEAAQGIKNKLAQLLDDRFYGDNRDFAHIFFAAATDSQTLLNSGNEEYQVCIQNNNGEMNTPFGNLNDLTLKPGQWIITSDNFGEHIYLQTENGLVCADESRATLADKNLEGPAFVLATSKGVDVSMFERQRIFGKEQSLQQEPITIKVEKGFSR